MRRATILCYHAVGDCPRADDPYDLYIPTERFASQMQFLAEKRRVITLQEALSAPTDTRRPSVAITFDDGYKSVLENAAPILDRHSFPSTMFLPTAFVGKVNTWSESPRGDFRIMDADDLRDLARVRMDVESHGHAHIDLSTCDPDEAASDLKQSRAEIERLTGTKPSVLAYPFGRSSTSTQEVAREIGFQAAFTLDERSSGRFALERVAILHLDGPRTFAAKTSGYWMGLRRSAIGEVAAAAVRRIARNPRS